MTVISIDFPAARLEREKLIIAVAGLIEANPHCADAAGVATFAFETRHWNKEIPDRFYRDVVPAMNHATALTWAHGIVDVIPGWRAAAFGKAEEGAQ